MATRDEKLSKKQKIAAILRNDGAIDVEKASQEWSQCCHFMGRKNRFCNVARSSGSRYCGSHRPAGEICLDSGGAECGLSGERCPCPLDPTHTVLISQLSAHTWICTARRREDALQTQPHYALNCNAGGDSQDEAEVDDLQKECEVDPDALLAKLRACYAAMSLAEDLPPLTGPEGGRKLTDADSCSSKELYRATEAVVVAAVARGQSAENRLRHARQDARLLLQLHAHGLLSLPSPTIAAPEGAVSHESPGGGTTDERVYVEMGAGQGLLGLAVHAAGERCRVVLVERAGTRRKAERLTRSSMESHLEGTAEEPTKMVGGEKQSLTCTESYSPEERISRVRTDIRHCRLAGLPGVRGAAVVVLAKHLCGGATDLALRSVLGLQRAAEAPENAQAVGVAIATCCHHACHWRDYTGRRWLRSQGFSPAEFRVFCRWSGWCPTLEGRTGSERSEEHSPPTGKRASSGADGVSAARPHNLSPAAMAEAGRMAKRVIDHGRAVFLRNKLGWKVSQVQYCETDLTPENVVIIGS